jgi:hypothetical protein
MAMIVDHDLPCGKSCGMAPGLPDFPLAVPTLLWSPWGGQGTNDSAHLR